MTESPVLFRTESCGGGDGLEFGDMAMLAVGIEPDDATFRPQIGVVTLNRPKQLNALTLEMCSLMLSQLTAWASDDAIVAVVLQGAGDKGFCAGGDVAEVIRNVRAGGETRFDYGDEFFTVEYALDLLIHQFPKPIIALSHGVCMGGGLGLIAGASHRVFATNSKIAMPEIHIGLFPDVAGGYFLNQLRDGAGLLMALTGHLITADDALSVGLAEHVIEWQTMQAAVDAMTRSTWSNDPVQNHLMLSALFEGMTAPTNESELARRAEATRMLAVSPSAPGFRDQLVALAAGDPYFSSAAKNLLQGSPTAAHVSFEYLRRSKDRTVDDVLALDLILAKQFQRHHDFTEGVRALLIDKDKAPKWSPASWADVSPTLIRAHFSAI
ncbi:MAG: enoyl-CoA hydratase/isomerase family protein [Betaproteobacteria bacterium]|nr:MAG: enoyl-CoA hydratase/isomerase family protein [Betaproteobacteria bacterium]